MKNKHGIKYGPLGQDTAKDDDGDGDEDNDADTEGDVEAVVAIAEVRGATKRTDILRRVAAMRAGLLLAVLTVLFLGVVCLVEKYSPDDLRNDRHPSTASAERNDDPLSKGRALIYSIEEYVNGRGPTVERAGTKSPAEKTASPADAESAVQEETSSRTDVSETTASPGNRRIVCYYDYPKSENDSLLRPEDLECSLCSHILVSFASIRNDTLFLEPAMETAVGKVLRLKECDPKLKVLISIGGAEADEGFPSMVWNHASRKKFIGSVRDALRRLKLDGVDLDWEFPGAGDGDRLFANGGDRQRQHFSQLLREIRREFEREGRGYLLTVAVAAPETIVRVAYDVDQIDAYADFVNLMSYDFHFFTKFTPFTGFNSPLYVRLDDVFSGTLCINYTADYWASKGMTPSKIVVGLPTYGHSFALVNRRNGSPGGPARGFGETGNLGFVDYSETCAYARDHAEAELCYDNDSSSPYLHDGYEWISYENERSVREKAKFVSESEYGGVMIYSLNSDDFSGKCSGKKFPLTKEIVEVFSNAGR